MEDQRLSGQEENQTEQENQKGKRHAKREEANQELMIEGMVRRFKHMLHSGHFDASFKIKLLTDMQEVINEEKGIGVIIED